MAAVKAEERSVRTPSPSLSRAQQDLVKLIRDINAGRIESLVVRGGQPVLPPPKIVRAIRLKDAATAADRARQRDHTITGPVLALLDVLTNLGDGVINRVEIEDGLPTTVILAGDTTILTESRENRPVWLTVTEAAKLLLTEDSGTNLSKARARVSRAADAERFRTNGATGRDRRIDRDSFSTWRIQQGETEHGGENA